MRSLLRLVTLLRYRKAGERSSGLRPGGHRGIIGSGPLGRGDRSVHVAWPTLVLAVTLAGPPPEKPEAEFAAQFAGLHVVVRLADDLCTGYDLRYEGGQFRLRQRDGELAFAEEKVVEAYLDTLQRTVFVDDDLTHAAPPVIPTLWLQVVSN